MGILADIIRFISVAILGINDSSKVFAEALEMSERYLRWGQERKDIRDFLAALQHIEKCHDDEAPKADLLLRKYSVILESTIGLMSLNINKYREANQKVYQDKNNIHDDIQATQEELDKTKAKLQELRDEGSMIKAKEVEKRVEELNRQNARLQAMLNSNTQAHALTEEYRKVSEECLRHKNRIEVIFNTMHQLEDISVETKNNMVNNSEEQVNLIMKDLEELDPTRLNQ
jgi:chromosome segregation ATPase